MAEKKITSDIRVEGKVITSGVQDPAGGSSTEYWKTDGTKGTPAGGAAVSQTDLTDAATLSWDIDAVPSAYLLATSAVGNSRMLSNASLANCVDGTNYQLTFQQDATGGRSVTFDTSFEVVGTFDLRPDKISIILVNFQDGIGRVVVTSWEGIMTNLTNVGTGAQILVGDTLRTLKAGANMTLTQSATEILFEAASGGGGGGAGTGVETMYLSSSGNDTTGATGNKTLPFLTINAALNAATSANVRLYFLTGGTFTSVGYNFHSSIFEKIEFSSRSTTSITISSEVAGTYAFPRMDFIGSGMTVTFGNIRGYTINIINMFVNIFALTHTFYSVKINYFDLKCNTLNCLGTDYTMTVDNLKLETNLMQKGTSTNSPITVSDHLDGLIGKIEFVEGTIFIANGNSLRRSRLRIGDIIGSGTFNLSRIMAFTNCDLIFLNSNITSNDANRLYMEINNCRVTGVILHIPVPHFGVGFFSCVNRVVFNLKILSGTTSLVLNAQSGLFYIIGSANITFVDCFVKISRGHIMLSLSNNSAAVKVWSAVGHNTFITGEGNILSSTSGSGDTTVHNMTFQGHTKTSPALQNSTYLTYSVLPVANTYE